jgi:DNA-binding response OmpR family regulator
MAPRRPAFDPPAERPVTILVADDDARVVELLEIAFGAHGWRVVRAADGEEAIRLAGSEQPDLVVLDVRLPRRSGLDVCEALRRDPVAADVPVIMVSAMAETEARIQGLARGADDYLAKPFSPKELVARIRRMLARSRDARATRRLGVEAEIELARTRDEARRQHQELRHAQRVREMSAAMTRDLLRRGDREDLAAAFLAALDAQLCTGLSALLAPGEDARRFEPVAVRGSGADRLLGLALARDGEVARLADGLGRVVRVAELERFPELRAELPALAAAGISLLAPVTSADGLEALLVLDDKRDGSDLTRAEVDLLHALLAELGTVLSQQRRLEAQATAMERLLLIVADRAEPGSVAARTEAAAWVTRVARDRSGSWRAAVRVGALVRLGGWIASDAAAAVLAEAAARDVTGNLGRLATLTARATARMSSPEEAVLVRAGWAWTAARVAGEDERAARERALAECAHDHGLALALRRAAPGGEPSGRHAA